MSMNVKMGLLLVGLVLCAISIFANFNLYVSLAANPIDKVTWGILGITFDVFKILIIISVYVLWSRGMPVLAMFAMIFWLTLTGVSLSTFFGYTSKVTDEFERKTAIESAGYVGATQSVQSAEQRVAQLEKYASLDSNTLQSKLDSLRAKEKTIEVALAKCPKGWNTRCIDPNTAKLDAVRSEIATVEQQIGNYQAYQGAIASKENALKQQSQALSSGSISSEIEHPMFTNGAVLLSSVTGNPTTARKLKVYFLAISAIIAELGASFLLFITSRLGNRDFETVPTMQTVNEQSDGSELYQKIHQNKKEAIARYQERKEALARDLEHWEKHAADETLDNSKPVATTQWSYPALSSFVGKKA